MMTLIGRYRWIIIVVAIVGAVAAYVVHARTQAHEVRVTAAVEGSLSLRIAASGLIEVESSDLAFQGSGRLIALYVDAGEPVKRLQLLARLSPSGSLPGAPEGDDVIHAPYDGTVVDVHLRAGSVVSAQQPVMRVVSNAAPWVTAFIDSEHAASLRPGHTLRCRAGGYLSEAQDIVVRAVGQEAVRRQDLPGSSRQIRVRCEAAGAPLDLAPGTEVDVDGEIALVDGGVLVPTTSVVHDGPHDRVWVVEDRLARPREVRLGPNNFDLIEIRDGVQPGDTVVVEGKQGLKEGLRVKA